MIAKGEIMNDLINTGNIILIIVLFVIGVIFGIIIGIRTGKAEAGREYEKKLPLEREDAIKRSRAVLGGLAFEQLAPWFPDFQYDPTELRFIGKPVDFIAFPGAGTGNINEIVFIEVKTGNSKLSNVEKSLKKVIERKAIRWHEYRLPSLNGKK